jgi:hypothetical protein
MKRCVELHDWIRCGDRAALERHIVWSKTGVRYQSNPDLIEEGRKPSIGDSFSLIATETSRQSIDRFTPGDVVLPALEHIRKEINDKLSENTTLRMLWHHDRDDVTCCAVPKNLLGAIWLQFAIAVETKTDFRSCAECQKWFEVTPGTGRKDKQFCSTACRVKNYRERKTRLRAPSDSSSK